MEIKTWVERCNDHPDHQTGMVSEGMIRARMEEEIGDLRAEIERTHALLKDPNVVAINMLRGVIAMPSVEQIRHIYQDRLLLPDLATVVKERNEARAEVERLRKEMREIAEDCESEYPSSYKKIAWFIRNALEAKP